MTQESQFELFNQKSSSYTPIERQLYFKPKLTLTLDHTIIVSIILLLIMVLSFSLGVERGKRIVRAPARTVIVAEPKQVAQVQPVPVKVPAKVAPQPVQQAQPAKPVKTNTAIPIPPVPQKIMPPVQPVAPVATEGGYTVQVASFKQEKYAKQEAMSLKQKGFQIYILPKGSHSIVCVGKFAQKQEAVAMSSKLRKYYKDCVVRNL